MIAHTLHVVEDPLPRILHASCSCGTLFVAVTAELDAREGVVAERHRIHVEQHRAADEAAGTHLAMRWALPSIVQPSAFVQVRP